MTETTPLNAAEAGHPSRLHIAVTVLIERRMVARGAWQMPVWRLSGVVAGDHLAPGNGAGSPAGQKVREAPREAPPAMAEGETFAWSGLTVTLYKDACERYWHALIGDKPRVYVVCRERDGEGQSTLEPVRVTVDYDEANAYGETDQQVLSGPIPASLYQPMEAFVLTHYKPKPFIKRKRRQWDTDRP